MIIWARAEDFNRGLHCMLDLDPKNRYIAHFPLDNAMISTSSNYGGNVLLGKKCLALRIGSHLAQKEGWLAEHMLILCAQSPDRRKNLCRRGLSQRLRQNQLRHAGPPSPFRRLENHHHRRRHRLDATRRRRPPLRHQSGKRLLRRRPREPTWKPTPTPWPPSRTTPFTPTWR